MTLHDKLIPNSDQWAECDLNDVSREQLEELRDSAIAYANALLRRHRKLRELILLIEHRIDAETRLYQTLGGC